MNGQNGRIVLDKKAR